MIIACEKNSPDCYVVAGLNGVAQTVSLGSYGFIVWTKDTPSKTYACPVHIKIPNTDHGSAFFTSIRVAYHCIRDLIWHSYMDSTVGSTEKASVHLYLKSKVIGVQEYMKLPLSLDSSSYFQLLKTSYDSLQPSSFSDLKTKDNWQSLKKMATDPPYCEKALKAYQASFADAGAVDPGFRSANQQQKNQQTKQPTEQQKNPEELEKQRDSGQVDHGFLRALKKKQTQNGDQPLTSSQTGEGSASDTQNQAVQKIKPLPPSIHSLCFHVGNVFEFSVNLAKKDISELEVLSESFVPILENSDSSSSFLDVESSFQGKLRNQTGTGRVQMLQASWLALIDPFLQLIDTEKTSTSSALRLSQYFGGDSESQGVSCSS